MGIDSCDSCERRETTSGGLTEDRRGGFRAPSVTPGRAVTQGPAVSDTAKSGSHPIGQPHSAATHIDSHDSGTDLLSYIGWRTLTIIPLATHELVSLTLEVEFLQVVCTTQ